MNNVKNFLDEVNKSSPVEGLKDYKKSGFDLNNQLNDLKKFVEALERNGKMCHCLEEFDKEALKSSSWQFALKKYVLPDLANYEKQVIFISVHLNNNLCADAGELEKIDNRMQAIEMNMQAIDNLMQPVDNNFQVVQSNIKDVDVITENERLLYAQSVTLQYIQLSIDRIPDLMVHFPYMFILLTADDFQTFKSTLMPKPSMDSHAFR